MQSELIQRISAQFPEGQVIVEVDGNRADIRVTSEVFRGMSRVKQQQAVYACIEDYISDGRLHAVNIKAQLPD